MFLWSGGLFARYWNIVLTWLSSLVKPWTSILSLSLRLSCTSSRELIPSNTSSNRSCEPTVGHWENPCLIISANWTSNIYEETTKSNKNLITKSLLHRGFWQGLVQNRGKNQYLSHGISNFFPIQKCTIVYNKTVQNLHLSNCELILIKIWS